MKKYLTVTFAALICTVVFSPNVIAQAATLVANQEKAFAALAVSSNTRDAFVAYYSDSVVIFNNGKILNGKTAWKSKPVDSSLLVWYPLLSYMSSDGELGFTTGPWRYKNKRTDSSYSYYGHYNSIWKRENNKWKVILDIGIPADSNANIVGKTVNYDHSKLIISPLKAKDELMEIENKFIQDGVFKNADKYRLFFTKRVSFCRPGLFISSPKDINSQILKAAEVVNYEVSKIEIAGSGDMGYAYGYVSYKNNKNNIVKANYLRIWIREVSGWKIIVDTIGGI